MEFEISLVCKCTVCKYQLTKGIRTQCHFLLIIWDWRLNNLDKLKSQFEIPTVEHN